MVTVACIDFGDANTILQNEALLVKDAILEGNNNDTGSIELLIFFAFNT